MKHCVSPEERETVTALGQVRGAFLGKVALGWAVKGTREPSNPPAHSQDPQMQGKFRGTEWPRGMHNGVGGAALQSLPGQGEEPSRPAGGQTGSHAKFGLHPLGTGFLIRRVMQFSLPNCVLIVHSLKIKRH